MVHWSASARVPVMVAPLMRKTVTDCGCSLGVSTPLAVGAVAEAGSAAGTKDSAACCCVAAAAALAGVGARNIVPVGGGSSANAVKVKANRKRLSELSIELWMAISVSLWE